MSAEDARQALAFDPDTAAGIVGHMNEDHADAVLAIARAHGGARDATQARLIAITPRLLEIEISADGDASGTVRTIEVAFDPPVDPLDRVRARLVALTRQARALLAS